MDRHTQDFYRSSSDEGLTGHFHKVICLQKEKGHLWNDLRALAPDLPRGWYELAQLKTADRVEFSKEYWSAKMPFQPGMSKFLDKFFGRIEDVRVYVVQPKFDDPFEAHLVYTLKQENGFFRGLRGAKEADINALQLEFPLIIFPQDYLVFMQIHNGFSKATDSGILPLNKLKETADFLQNLVASKEEPLKSGELLVDPKSLIPFYKSFGLPFFQCFYTDWYPRNEMGNVYYSNKTNAISDLSIRETSVENMAFTTFAKWLIFYLEAIS